jgi:multiple sugar transport system permease protein
MKKKNIISYIILVFVAIIMLFPMFWMILLSLKSFPEQYTNFTELILSKFTLHNFSDVLNSDAFDTYFINSLIVAIFVTIGNVVFCTLTAYALARRNFLGKSILYASILGVLIIPSHIIMIPLYRLMVNLDWINTYWALTIPWLITPFGIFLVLQYIKTIPIELEESAKIDGAGYWNIIFKIIFPVSKPIIIVLSILTFLSNWNSFLFPFIFTNDIEHRTLPVGLAFYLGKQSIDWGHLMAGAAIASIPIIILFVIFQKHIIKGMVSGALKE